MSSVIYTKRYVSVPARQRAASNHAWLTTLSPPVQLPAILGEHDQHIDFEYIRGRHIEPGDLPGIARHLGAVHACACRHELRYARLSQPYATHSGSVLGEFTSSRTELLRAHHPATPQPADLGLLLAAVSGHAGTPAAFYKDTNPRNLLATPAGPVTIDFDDLTLAPFGYDLAKLITTLAMTYGPLPPDLIHRALAAYNHQTAPLVPAVTFETLMTWAEIHHVLTARYTGQGNYRHGWHTVRPCPAGGA